MPYTVMYWPARLPAAPLGEQPPGKGAELHQSGPFHLEVQAWMEVERILREMPEYKVALWRGNHRIADDAGIRRRFGIK